MSFVPAGWCVRPIGQLVEVLDGRRVPISAKERSSRIGEVPYYGATGQVGWIDQALFDEELVLLGEDGVQFFESLKQKAYRITGPSWVNNHAHVLRPQADAIDGRYLTYFLNQIDYRGLANGTTRLKLTQAAMRRINIVAPGLEEQRRIVEILEDHLSRLEAAGSYLDASAQRIASLNESVLVNLDELKSADRTAIGDVIGERLRHGRSVPTADQGFPVLRLTAIRDGRVDLSQRKIGSWNRADAEPYLVQEGDFLVARGSGSRSLVGRGGLVVGDPDAVAYPDTAIRARPNTDLLDARYLAIIWDSREVRQQIESAARTTAGIYKVNQTDLLRVVIPLPTRKTQRAVVAQVRDMTEARARLAAQVEATRLRGETLRRSLLAAAFSGQLTGASTDDEIIEELAGV